MIGGVGVGVGVGTGVAVGNGVGVAPTGVAVGTGVGVDVIPVGPGDEAAGASATEESFAQPINQGVAINAISTKAERRFLKFFFKRFISSPQAPKRTLNTPGSY